jgi:tyrosine-protein kinase Etk/Wzc
MSESSFTGEQESLSGDRETDLRIADESDVSIFDIAIVLAKRKAIIFGLPLLAAVAAAIYSLLVPNVYTATSKILPPQQSQSTASAVAAQLGALGLGGLTPIKNPSEVYVSMLKSRTVADNLIKHFDLHALYKKNLESHTRAELGKATEITLGKDGIIAIAVSDLDPKRAAAISNAYIDELRKLTNVLAVSEASQRRLFFEQQFAQARDQLAKAEHAARQALQKGGLANVEGQGRALIDSTARLRGQITVKEVQIGAMRTFAAEGNPELRLAQQELEALKRELGRIEGTGSVRVADAASGGTGLDNVRLLRDLKYYETIYELLAKQYEMAKIDEAKDSAIIQVLEAAVEPDVRSHPKRTQMVLIWTFAALFIALIWAFAREALEKARSDPKQARRLEAFRRYLAWR